MFNVPKKLKKKTTKKTNRINSTAYDYANLPSINTTHSDFDFQ